MTREGRSEVDTRYSHVGRLAHLIHKCVLIVVVNRATTHADRQTVATWLQTFSLCRLTANNAVFTAI